MRQEKSFIEQELEREASMKSFEESKSHTLIDRLGRIFKPVSKPQNHTAELILFMHNASKCGIPVDEAVKNFQAMHSNLMIDGIIGPKTYETMTDYYTSTEIRELFGLDNTSRN